jgi:hypothetical protein
MSSSYANQSLHSRYLSADFDTVSDTPRCTCYCRVPPATYRPISTPCRTHLYCRASLSVRIGIESATCSHLATYLNGRSQLAESNHVQAQNKAIMYGLSVS